MDEFKVFIVEDDPWYGRILHHHLSLNPDYEVTLFQDGKSVLENLYLAPNVICLDYGLPDISGDKLLTKIKKKSPHIPIIVISGQEDISVAVELLKIGARDYIIKGDNTKDLLWKSISNVRENVNLKHEVDDLKEQLQTKYSFDSIIGKSEPMQRVFTLMSKGIKSNINVSITGGTGTGKEVIAKAIHYNSARKKMPFVAINMASIPSNLLESELFGHEKGAFTGAISKKIGKFELAGNGTLFLDEMAEMDIDLQSKILRVMQEREFNRVGGSKNITLNARIISATHKNLIEEVQKGSFREDLYFRLMGLPIDLPPLRNRGEDILLLAEHFVDSYANENGLSGIHLSKKSKDKLLAYSFPGNVRELKAMIDLACVMMEGKTIHPEDLTFLNTKKDSMLSGEEKSLKEYNNEIISYYLNKYNNNVATVSKKLDIGKSTIYNFLNSE